MISKKYEFVSKARIDERALYTYTILILLANRQIQIKCIHGSTRRCTFDSIRIPTHYYLISFYVCFSKFINQEVAEVGLKILGHLKIF
jgi:hypothetical protein